MRFPGTLAFLYDGLSGAHSAMPPPRHGSHVLLERLLGQWSNQYRKKLDEVETRLAATCSSEPWE